MGTTPPPAPWATAATARRPASPIQSGGSPWPLPSTARRATSGTRCGSARCSTGSMKTWGWPEKTERAALRRGLRRRLAGALAGLAHARRQQLALVVVGLAVAAADLGAPLRAGALDLGAGAGEVGDVALVGGVPAGLPLRALEAGDAAAHRALLAMTLGGRLGSLQAHPYHQNERETQTQPDDRFAHNDRTLLCGTRVAGWTTGPARTESGYLQRGGWCSPARST